MTVAVFLDRDGVINENRADHVIHPDDVRLVPGALGALALFARVGLPCYVVTNQAIVGRGVLSQPALDSIHHSISEAVRRAGGAIAGFYYCPHTPEQQCACRKPLPGLLQQAADDHDLDLTRCYLIGDALSDVQAAQAAGCTPILVRTGRGLTQMLHEDARHLRGYYVAAHPRQAARWIVQRERSDAPGHPLHALAALLAGRRRSLKLV